MKDQMEEVPGLQNTPKSALNLLSGLSFIFAFLPLFHSCPGSPFTISMVRTLTVVTRLMRSTM